MRESAFLVREPWTLGLLGPRKGSYGWKLTSAIEKTSKPLPGKCPAASPCNFTRKNREQSGTLNFVLQTMEDWGREGYTVWGVLATLPLHSPKIPLGYSNRLGTCCIICTFHIAHVSNGRLWSNLIVLWAQPREKLQFLSLGQVPSWKEKTCSVQPGQLLQDFRHFKGQGGARNNEKKNDKHSA